MMRCLLTVLTLLALPAHAVELHKWVDEQGRVHYSDQPGGTVSQKLNVPSAPATGEARAEPKANAKGAPADAKGDAKDGKEAKKTGPLTPAEKELEFRKRRMAAEEAAAKEEKKKAEAERMRQYCTEARNSLRAMENTGRIVRYNDKGERVYLDDAAAQRAIEQARENVAKNCSS